MGTGPGRGFVRPLGAARERLEDAGRPGKVNGMDRTERFETERARLVGIAARVLADHAEAEDIVQQAWLRLQRQDDDPDNLPAWLTTVTTRLCLDRLRSRIPVPAAEIEAAVDEPDVADDLVLANTVGVALQAVLERLSAPERVAFVLHDSFGFEFPEIAAMLDTTPAAARKLASRARAKVRRPAPKDAVLEDALPEEALPRGGLADWEVVDAFMAAARNGEFDRLMRLLAPDVAVSADDAAILTGTPQRIDGRREVAAFFNGSARSALPVYVGTRPAAAWFHRGAAKVLFDFTVIGEVVGHITFRAEPEVLAQVVRRDGQHRRD